MKVIIIGSGPGGADAAIYAAQNGCEVTLIEQGKIGGTCLNVGCMPTKSLLASTEVIDLIHKSDDYGIKVAQFSVDYDKIQTRKKVILNDLRTGLLHQLAINNIKVIEGQAFVEEQNSVRVLDKNGQETHVQGDFIILATGSTAIVPQVFQSPRTLTSNDILHLEKLPVSLTIIGGGAIGCELGQYLSLLGVKVTIIEAMTHILPREDEDVATSLKEVLETSEITILEGNKVEDVTASETDVRVKLSNGKEITSEYLLVAIGRKANTEGLISENLDIKKDERGQIVVNDKMQTNIANIYAIGDIVPSPQLAHVANKEAVVAVNNIMNRPDTISYKAVPSCIYTTVEAASVGIRETELKSEQKPYLLAQSAFKYNGKAKTSGNEAGFCKILADLDGKILGASIVGKHITEMLPVFSLAIENDMTIQQISKIIYAHPSRSKIVLEALRNIKKIDF